MDTASAEGMPVALQVPHVPWPVTLDEEEMAVVGMDAQVGKLLLSLDQELAERCQRSELLVVRAKLFGVLNIAFHP